MDSQAKHADPTRDGLTKMGYLPMKKFADFAGVEQTTLRYWDDIDLFAPAKRNPETGYRYYTPAQTIAVNFITVLSALGVPLKSIHSLKAERSPEKIISLLEAHERDLDQRLRQITEAYSVIHTRRDLIRLGLRETPEDIFVATLDEAPFFLGSPNTFAHHDDEFYTALAQFSAQAQEQHINLHYPIGGYFDSMEAFRASPGQPTRFFSITPTGTRKRERGRYLIGHIHGPYGQMGDLPDRLQAYADAHKLRFTGPVYAVYLHDELTHANPNHYLARVLVPIEEQE